jgi:hypothetical protein
MTRTPFGGMRRVHGASGARLVQIASRQAQIVTVTFYSILAIRRRATM